MSKMVILIPTRNRPHAAAEVRASIERTQMTGDVDVLFGVDWDDPSKEQYLDILPWNEVYQVVLGGSFGGVLNALANSVVDRYDILGSVGDDHRFRTSGWDRRVVQSLAHRPGIVYANDRYPVHSLPTNVFMNAEIVRTLGYMALPQLRHMYIDNAWKALGEKTGMITYLPDVIIEHMHYSVGLSKFDDTYARTNTDKQKLEDRVKYEQWLKTGLARDAEAISGR